MSRHKGKRYEKSEKFNHDKKPIHPYTSKQADFMSAIRDHDLVFTVGYPGTSKTLISTYMAFEHIDNRDSPINKLIVTRNITDAEGSKSIGALPGELEDKTKFYLEPVFDALGKFMTKGRVDLLKKTSDKKIEFIPYEMIRGRSFDDAFIMVEEAQNFTAQQMYSVLTRLGERSKMVVNGDHKTQRDLSSKFGVSGLEDAISKLGHKYPVVYFDSPEDIFRSGVTKDVILAYYGY